MVRVHHTTPFWLYTLKASQNHRCRLYTPCTTCMLTIMTKLAGSQYGIDDMIRDHASHASL